MKLFTLNRYEETDTATFGMFYHEDVLICETLELPWRQNHVEVSCIPEGTYFMGPYSSPHFEEAILIDPVPGRTGILIHAGNTTKDTHGCILVGNRQLGEDIVLDSRDNLRKILDILGPDTGILEVTKS